MQIQKMAAWELLILALILLHTVGCAKKTVMAPPPPYPPSLLSEDLGPLRDSLFKGDQAVLSNQDIERILGGRVTLDDRHRMAVLGLAPAWSWSEELFDLESQNLEHFLQVLTAAPQLTQVRAIPPLLIPEKKTVPYLREAAARFQSDLLLVYATRVQTFRKDRLIGTDAVRARCIVEAVLLDVRTGIVLQASRGAEDVFAKKSSGEINFAETISKAETEASGKALIKVGDEVVAYLRDAGK